MTPEQWKQVGDLYHAALKHLPEERDAFLRDACGGNDGLQREVSSLLARADQASEFLEVPALELVGQELAQRGASSLTGRFMGLGPHLHVLTAGTRLGPYVIHGLIGQGGMGEVYRAHDTRLRRDVAIKVLPSTFARDNDRLGRFQREAEVLASLNHPHIATIYGIEEFNGTRALVMELVKGKTLAELMPRKGFSLAAFFDIAVPLTDAVAAAHEQGVVHRDLKPGNVMVGDDGRVKVLDFGLARPAVAAMEPVIAGADPAAMNTAAGVIVGTWGYMSPEQALGNDVDGRGDIFSLGIILFEMLTGRRPFGGDTPAEALSSIINDVPPTVAELRAGLPRELSRVVRRCLAKEPARRLRSAADLRNELADLHRELESGELRADARPAPRTAFGWSTTWRAVAAVLLGAVVGVSVWLAMDVPDARVPRFQNPLQVTSAAGRENFPTWSPDAGRIAYVSDQSGNEDIWVTQLTGGAAANFTAEHRGSDRDPAWSPDGGQIAFVSDREGGGIFVMPAIGGRAVRISPRGSAEGISNPQWSSDGTELAHIRREAGGSVIEIVSLRTREARRVLVPGDTGNRLHLSWSADGRFFAYVRAASRDAAASRIWILRASDATSFAVTDGMTSDWSPIWSEDARTLFFVTNRGGSMDLWQQPLSADGEPQGDAAAVTVGIGMQHAAFAPNARKLVYSKGGPAANVWRVPILRDREAVWADAEQLTFDQASISSLDLFPQGDQMLVGSDRSGNHDIWSVPIRGGEMRQLTTDRTPDSEPRVSPDGQQIAFGSYRSGNRDIWVMPAEGGRAMQLTDDPDADMFPSWSPDGLNILFYSSRTGNVDAFSVPAGGGEARRITTEPSEDYFPQLSPDGQWMVFASYRGDGANRLWRMPAAGGTAEQLMREPAYYFRWSADGTHIYFNGRERGNNDLWALTLKNGRQRRLTRFSQKAGSIGPYALALYGEHLYFTWRNDLGDIWVMDVADTPE